MKTYICPCCQRKVVIALRRGQELWCGPKNRYDSALPDKKAASFCGSKMEEYKDSNKPTKRKRKQREAKN